MKKHILRILTGLMIACFGVGVLAACGGDPATPVDPGTAPDPIEGVWSGAESAGMFGSGSAVDHYVATVDLLSGADHDGYVVLKITEVAAEETTAAEEPEYPTYHFAFPIDKEGENYKGDLLVFDDTVEVTVTLAENKLTATIPSFDEGGDPTTLTFDKKEALPTAIAPTGTYYADYDGDYVYTVDFTNKAFKVNGETAPTKFANAGNFVVIEMTMPGEDSTPSITVCMVVYQANDTYYLSIIGEAYELTTTPPTPTPETYTVTFDAGDAGGEATGLPAVTDVFEEGDTYTLPSDTPQWSESARTFTGWKADTDGQTYQPGGSYTFTASNVTFTAQWSPAEAPTTDINGVWTHETTTITIKFEDSTGSAIVKSGTTYTYFSLTGAEGTYTGTDAMEEKTISITVVGNDLSVTLTYSSAQTYTHTSDLPARLEIEGTYADDSENLIVNFTDKTLSMFSSPVGEPTFEGIGNYIVISGGEMPVIVYKDADKYYASVGDSSMEIKLYTPAPTTYKVTFDKNAGSDNVTGMPADAEGQEAGAYEIPDATPQRAGYNFVGWTLTADGNGDVYKHGDAQHSSVTIEDKDITLYAKWEAKKYTVTFNVGDHGTASGTTSYTEQTVESNAITVPDVTANAGYKFTGWKVKGEPVEGTYTVNADDAVEDAITIEAQYEAIKYAVKYQSGVDGDSNVDKIPADGEISWDKELDIPEDPTRKGYTFAGWTVPGKTDGTVNHATGKLAITAEIIAQATGSDEEKVITLTATWTEKTYTLNFYKEKGQEDAADYTKTVTAQEALGGSNVPEAPEKKYYHFDGWYLDDDETEVNAAFAPYNKDTGDITEFKVYAKWTLVESLPSDTQTASPDAPITIGADGNTSGKPEPHGNGGTGVQWTGKIEKGYHYQYSGTQTSAAENVGGDQLFKSILTFIWSGLTRHGFFRADRFIADNTWSDNALATEYATAENWVFTKGNSTNDFGEKFINALNGTFSIDIDWTDEAMIVVYVQFTATGGKEAGYGDSYYTIMASAGHTLKDEYSIGFACELAQAKITSIVKDQTAVELPIEVAPANMSEATSDVVVGDADFTLNFTDTNPVWIGKSFKQGETITLTGTVKSAGTNGFHIPIAYLMSGKYNYSLFRLDGCGIFGHNNWEGFNVASKPALTGADSNYGGGPGNSDTEFLNAIKEGVNITITYKWEEANKITITAKYEKDGLNGGRETVFTVTPMGSKFLANEYHIGLGGEKIYLQVTSVVYPEA